MKLLAMSSASDTEYIISEVSDGLVKILVACVYNPHKCHPVDCFFLSYRCFFLIMSFCH